MNTFMNGLKDATNLTHTENGALTHKTTKSNLLDMFAMGAAMRNRSDADVILMFRKAFDENPVYALKCLFYIRDIRGGQGERRFFRVCMKDLASYNTDAARRNLIHVPEFGRWDDLYTFIGTPLETEALSVIKHQLALDVQCKTPSLLAKWLPSENASSGKTKHNARLTRRYLGWTPREYRKTLSELRKRINVLERLMSEGRWDEIEFDKIPSKAGMKYKNAFARHDIERMKMNKDVVSYKDFAKDTTTKVNAKTLYPYECVAEAMKIMGAFNYWGRSKGVALDDTNRLMTNKYWDNLEDYFNKATFNGMAIVDTSGSMCGCDASAPINVALSLGMYCAEKSSGPFANHFITFSSRPTFVEVEGVDFCDKVYRMSQADWGINTNVEAAFDLMLNTAIRHNCSQDEIPQNLIIISDMEFDSCATSGPVSGGRYGGGNRITSKDTLFEAMSKKWANNGYQMPHLVFWNVNARQNNIPMLGNGPVSYVSGFSPSIFETIMSGKTGYMLMMEKLDSPRYSAIH